MPQEEPIAEKGESEQAVDKRFQTVTPRVTAFMAVHSQKVLFTALILTFLLVGAAGEAAAHNPGGHEVPGCANGADTVAHQNPNCHS